jgi:protein ImuB
LSAHVPFVLVTPGARGLRLTACNDEARARGLQPGERLADARAKVPDLASAVHEPTEDAASLLRMARWAERWSPWVAMDPPDGLLLDVTGVAHLFGGEAMLVADMSGRFGKLNVTARAGLAGTAPAARAIARFGQLGSPIVAEGAERTALATLPVEALDLDPDTVMTLRRAGLKRIGQLYDVPRASLARRFRAKDRHARLMERLDASLGLTQTPLSPLSPPVEFAVRHSVMEPLMSHDGVLAMLEHLTRTLCLKLTRAGEGAVYVELALYRADGSRAIVQAGLSRPSARAEHLERLLAPRLEKIDMGFGVDAASLKARETQALSAVQEALTGEGSAGTELAELADRIAAREDGAPVSVNVPAGSHQPERAEEVKGFGEAGTAFLQGTRPSDREAGFARARAGVEQGDCREQQTTPHHPARPAGGNRRDCLGAGRSAGALHLAACGTQGAEGVRPGTPCAGLVAKTGPSRPPPTHPRLLYRRGRGGPALLDLSRRPVRRTGQARPRLVRARVV